MPLDMVVVVAVAVGLLIRLSQMKISSFFGHSAVFWSFNRPQKICSMQTVLQLVYADVNLKISQFTLREAVKYGTVWYPVH